MKKILGIIFTFMMLLLTSCSLVVDIEPKSENKTEEISKTPDINNQYIRLEVDYSNAKTSFTGAEIFDNTGLIVYGVKSDNTKSIIDSSLYNISLLNANSFTQNGDYTVKITYNNLFITYPITYSKIPTNVIYDNISFDLNSTYEIKDGELIDNIKLYVEYNNIKYELDSKDYSLSIKELETNQEYNLINKPGSYLLVATYTGNLNVTNKEKRTIITVEKYLSSEITSLSVTGYDQETSVIPDFNNLIVTGISEKGNKVLNKTDYNVTLYSNNNLINNIDIYGTYKVVVTYKTLEYSFNIRYVEENPTLSLYVSNLENYYQTKPVLTDFILNKQGKYGNEVIDSSKYTYKLYLNDNLVTDFSVLGTYKLIYVYYDNTVEVDINYTGPKINSLKIEGINEIYNVIPTFDNIIVKALYDDKEEIYKNYTISLKTSGGKDIDNIISNGKYIIVVYCNDDYTIKTKVYFDVKVEEKHDVTIKYEYKNQVFTDLVKSMDMYELSPNSISVPSGYYLLGYKDNFTKIPLEDNNYVITALIAPNSTIPVVSFINENYKVYEYSYFGKNKDIVIPDNLFPTDGKLERTAADSQRIICYSVTSINSNDINVNISAKDGLMKIQTYNDSYDSVVYSSVYLYKDGESVLKIKDLNQNLTNIVNGNYYLEGKFIFKYNSDLYIYELNSTNSSYNYSVSLDSNRILTTSNPSNMINDIYPEGLSFKCDYLLDNTPKGYKLSYFNIYDENNNLVKEINYLGETILYISDLNPETNYKICPYYKKIINPKLKKEIIQTSDVLGCYVWVQTYERNTNVCKVEIKYKLDRIYCYYVEKGAKINCFLEFKLPDKYSDYIMLGTYDDVEKINKNTVINVELVTKQEWENKNMVVFYDYPFIHSKKILKIETVEDGGSATSPKNLDDKIINGYTYVFSGWDTEITNIHNSIEVYAKYLCNTIPTPTFKNNMYYYNGILQVNVVSNIGYYLNSTYKNALISRSIQLYDQADNLLTYSEISNDWLEYMVTPGSAYKLSYKYLYDYGTGELESADTIEFTIPQQTSKPLNFRITETGDQYIFVSRNTEVSSNVIYYRKNKMKSILYNNDKKQFTSISDTFINGLCVNQDYELLLGEIILKDNYVLNCFFDKLTFTTKDEEAPMINGIDLYVNRSTVNGKMDIFAIVYGKNIDKYMFETYKNKISPRSSLKIEYINADKSQTTKLTCWLTAIDSTNYKKDGYDYVVLSGKMDYCHNQSPILSGYIEYADEHLSLYSPLNHDLVYSDTKYEIVVNSYAGFTMISSEAYTKEYKAEYFGDLYDSKFDIKKMDFAGYSLKGINSILNDIDYSQLTYNLYKVPNNSNPTIENISNIGTIVTDFDETSDYVISYTYNQKSGITKVHYDKKQD